MKLSQVKAALKHMQNLRFQLPNGEFVPSHFHITEVGKSTKKFIDCGGTIREEHKVNFQLWTAQDTDHALGPEKLLDIIQLSERILGIPDFEVEVEYQSETIGKYGLEIKGDHFLLTYLQTDCLAKDGCGIPEEKTKVALSHLQKEESCTPGSGCC